MCSHQLVVRLNWDHATALRYSSKSHAAVLGPTCWSGIHPERSLDKRVLYLSIPLPHPSLQPRKAWDRLYGLFSGQICAI